MDIKPIETRHNGYRFRSRLEARWAVYFDALKIEYEYEREGYDLGEAGWYLPDFWLPQVNMWAEVKPKEFTDEELRKCRALARGTQFPVLLLDGPPRLTNYWAVVESDWPDWPSEVDYFLFGGGQYWLTENRFWSSTATTDYPDHCEESETFADDAARSAVIAARQARFEYGSNGVAEPGGEPWR